VNWRELAPYAFAGVLLVVIVFGTYFATSRPSHTNFGFDDTWECIPQEKGDPVCFKKR
jgi:hypothetical protein